MSFAFDSNHLCCRTVFHSYLSSDIGSRRKMCGEGERGVIGGRGPDRDNRGVSNFLS